MFTETKIIDGFKVYEGKMGDFMDFSWSEIEKSIEVFNSNNLSCLTVTEPFLKDINGPVNLEFLCKMKVQKLIISLNRCDDLKGLYCLKNLEFLRIITNPEGLMIELQQLPALKELEMEWYKGLRNLSQCKSLLALRLEGYKSRDKSLSELAGLKNLEVLKITKSNIEHVDGIENLPHLKRLILAYNRNLLFFTEKDDVRMNLEELKIEMCKKIDLTTLKGLARLKTLSIVNNGKVPSLEPVLKQLPELEVLFFSESEIIEGDNSYFLKYPNLKKLYFDNKSHYTFKLNEVREAFKDDSKRQALLKKAGN
jgi:Leucine-rich repeat (LRR) protein